jgi:hypothetical protein
MSKIGKNQEGKEKLKIREMVFLLQSDNYKQLFV